MSDFFGVNLDLSRRQILEGGLALGMVTLAGCASGNRDIATDAPLNWPTKAEPVPGPPAIAKQPTPWLPPTVAQPTPPIIGGMAVLPRSAWTRTGVARAQNLVPMSPINRITIHHDGMTAFTSTDQQAAARRIENIRNSHVNRKARDGSLWADIGYHYIIDPAGRVWEGRETRYQGAHVEFNNEGNLGIMCLGNYFEQSVTPAQKATLDRFVAEQMRRYRVPLTRVYTHQELRSTACPGASLQAYMVQTRGLSGTLRLAMASSDRTLV